MILIDYFEKTARDRPDKEFLHFVAAEAADDEHITYGEAERRASRISRALANLGVRKGDTVSMLLPNSPIWLLIYLANQKLGAVTGTLDPDHTPKELEYNVAHSQARILMVDRKHLEKARAIRGQCPKLETVVLVDDDAPDCVSLSAALELLADTPAARDPAISPDDTLYIMFTSGTTSGVPKGVLHPQRSLIHGIGPYRELVPILPDDRLMLVTPLFHACSMYWGVTLTILAGASLVLAERFSGTRFWEQARRGDVSVVWTMGTVGAILLQLPPSEAEHAACKRVRTFFGVGIGAREKEARTRWGCTIVDGFGMTETAGTVTDADSFDNAEPFPCVGKPVPGIDLRLMDPETGKFCGPRQYGEIVVKFGQGFSGYFNNPEAEAASIRDGWFHTGDLAYRDERGQYYFVDRLKDIVRRGGENISAREVEQVLLGYPKVKEAVVVPAPHPIYGEVVMAFLVPQDPSHVFTLDEIRAHCADRLAAFKLPAHVRTVRSEDLPRTPTGKVQKFKLRPKQSLPDAPS
ncbi:MAG: class I adenylate-forming enzyme family protein [Alphaproteobacteria bacterium]